MWDEKKFFEDYVNESEKIKPDDRFVEQLKNMAVQKEKKKKPIPMIKYMAVAASFVLCIGLGSVMWHNQNAVSGEEETNKKGIEFETELQAGMQSSDQLQESSEEQASSETNDEDAITEALNSIKQGAVVRDENGNELSQSQQEELWNLLKNAKETKQPENVAKTASYFLEGEQVIEVEVWENNFIQINGSWYQ